MPVAGSKLSEVAGADPRFPWDRAAVHLDVTLLNLDTMKRESVALVPMGCGDAILRRMTMPAAP